MFDISWEGKFVGLMCWHICVDWTVVGHRPFEMDRKKKEKEMWNKLKWRKNRVSLGIMMVLGYAITKTNDWPWFSFNSVSGVFLDAKHGVNKMLCSLKGSQCLRLPLDIHSVNNTRFQSADYPIFTHIRFTKLLFSVVVVVLLLLLFGRSVGTVGQPVHRLLLEFYFLTFYYFCY